MNLIRQALPQLFIATAALSLLAGATHQAQAQGYVADAQISSQPAGDGTYNYTITLNNDSSSLTPIGVFWFAWVPNVYGYDLLTSAPNSIQAPDGWQGYMTGGYSYYYPDGYGIEFVSDGTPLAPGSSLTFGFNTADSPATLSATSPYFNLPASTSTLYNSYVGGDPGAQISVTPVAPEPSSLALLIVGSIGLIFANRRHFPKFQLAPATKIIRR